MTKPRATASSRPHVGNSVVKVRILNKAGAAGGRSDVYPSQQIEPDKFAGIYGTSLVVPPYNFSQLSNIAEMHPVHGAALEQKAADILGQGLHWEAVNADAPETEKDTLAAWLTSLEREATLGETLAAALLDYETFGWGIIEVLRDIDRNVRGLVHVPAQTVRAHIDRKRLVQIVNEKRVWFRRWGAFEDKDEPILSATGNKAPASTQTDKLANDLLVFRKTSRRSAVYGVPGYVSAIGHIAMSLAARDYNVAFFGNAREPRYMFIVEGPSPEEVDATLDTLELALNTKHGEPHRNLLTGAIAGCKIRVEKMTDVGNDEHFTRLTETADGKILIAHRIPADRLGAAVRGTLGGSVTKEVSEVYRDAVCAPAQQLVVDRFNRFLLKEYGQTNNVTKLQWRLALDPLDLSDEAEDAATTVTLIKVDLITLNEGRARMGLEAMAGGDVTLSVYLQEHGIAQGGGGGFAAAADDEPHRHADLDEVLNRVVAKLDDEEGRGSLAASAHEEPRKEEPINALPTE